MIAASSMTLSSIVLACLLVTITSFSMPVRSSSSSSTTLGATQLQQLVLDAASFDQTQSLDLHGILWLEHMNLVVGSKELAEHFYQDILGFTRDPTASFHVNLGQQQFHLSATGDPAQKVSGSIGLVVPSLATVRERAAAAAAAEKLAGTEFAVLSDHEECMTMTCPWGNRLHLYDAAVDAQQQKPVSDSPMKMVKAHAQGGAYAASRMAVRGNPGIRFIEVACRVGTSALIGRFYRQMLGCTVSTSVTTAGQEYVAVCVGPGVHLVYVESGDLTEADLQKMEGVHICVYAADFEGLYQRLKAHNLIWTNPRFTHLDSCDTWGEAMASRTLRFKDIINLETGEKLIELEHETRPLRHGQYLKVPKYEAM